MSLLPCKAVSKLHIVKHHISAFGWHAQAKLALHVAMCPIQLLCSLESHPDCGRYSQRRCVHYHNIIQGRNFKSAEHLLPHCSIVGPLIDRESVGCGPDCISSIPHAVLQLSVCALQTLDCRVKRGSSVLETHVFGTLCATKQMHRRRCIREIVR